MPSERSAPVFSVGSAVSGSLHHVTSPTDSHDTPAVVPPWWWDAATAGARKSGAHLQDALTLALRQRAPRIVEVIQVERDHGLAAVTADTLIVAIDRGQETRTTEIPADQITAVLRKQANVINVRCGNANFDLRVLGDQLEAAIVGLRARTSTTRPDGPRHTVAPPSRRLATPQRVSGLVEQTDRRVPLKARRSATPIGMGSRRAETPAEPERLVAPAAPADADARALGATTNDRFAATTAVPPPASAVPPAIAPPANAAGWDYVRCSDGVWRRPSATPPLTTDLEVEDERLQ